MAFLETLVTPTKVILEEESPEGLTKIIERTLLYLGMAGKPVLFVIDPGVPGLKDIVEGVKADGSSVTVFHEVRENPPVDVVDRVADIVRKEEVELVWGIGGGSAMDTAKASVLLARNPGSLEKYLSLTFDTSFEPRENILICTPTTAGTGAEVTRFGVYTSSSGRKYSLASPFLQPDYAILLPSLTYSLSPAVTAATAFDALTHAIEVLWNKNADEMTVEVATNAAVKVLRAMPRAYESALKGVSAGRKEMLLAANAAGIAFNITGTAAIHALSFPLSEKWHIPHGVACAFFFEDVWNINVQADTVKRRLDLVARRAGLKDADELFNHIVDLKKKMGLPFTFDDLGVKCEPPGDLPQFLDTLEDPKMKNNIVPFDERMIIEILQSK